MGVNAVIYCEENRNGQWTLINPNQDIAIGSEDVPTDEGLFWRFEQEVAVNTGDSSRELCGLLGLETEWPFAFAPLVERRGSLHNLSPGLTRLFSISGISAEGWFTFTELNRYDWSHPVLIT